ncbi:MAG: Coenzyme F420 hydrogenase/dehydrogenase, beta subunit C-terminal domain [Ruminococcus sp.]
MEQGFKTLVYAVKHKDFETRIASRSGGIFTALSDCVLEKQGIVYGCVLTDDFNAIHIRAVKTTDRNKMRGSKYIQSDMGDMFNSVKNDLENDRLVLFSGTSCQVAGLKAFLQKPYEKLFCVDILCHGVPSPRVWQDYIKYQEEIAGGKCTSVDFRNKRDFGWLNHIETLYFDNGKHTDSEIFKTLFFNHSILRPCCYKCPYKSTRHPSDITIADYWGIDKAVPNFNDNKGVSLVLVNSELGFEFFDKVKNSIEYRESSIENSMQPALIKPTDKPDNREEFWDDYSKKSFKYIAKKYGNFSLTVRLKRKAKKTIKKIIGK